MFTPVRCAETFAANVNCYPLPILLINSSEVADVSIRMLIGRFPSRTLRCDPRPLHFISSSHIQINAKTSVLHDTRFVIISIPPLIACCGLPERARLICCGWLREEEPTKTTATKASS